MGDHQFPLIWNWYSMISVVHQKKRPWVYYLEPHTWYLGLNADHYVTFNIFLMWVFLSICHIEVAFYSYALFSLIVGS